MKEIGQLCRSWASRKKLRVRTVRIVIITTFALPVRVFAYEVMPSWRAIIFWSIRPWLASSKAWLSLHSKSVLKVWSKTERKICTTDKRSFRRQERSSNIYLCFEINVNTFSGVGESSDNKSNGSLKRTETNRGLGDYVDFMAIAFHWRCYIVADYLGSSSWCHSSL